MSMQSIPNNFQVCRTCPSAWLWNAQLPADLPRSSVISWHPKILRGHPKFPVEKNQWTVPGPFENETAARDLAAKNPTLHTHLGVIHVNHRQEQDGKHTQIFETTVGLEFCLRLRPSSLLRSRLPCLRSQITATRVPQSTRADQDVLPISEW